MPIKNKLFYVFLALWFFLQLLQASFTEIHPDEAYYWIYSKHLSWGYFDHPPFVALAIKIGYSFFQNTLGIRLIHIFLQLGTFYLISKTIEIDIPQWKQNNKLVGVFYSILLSLPLLQAYGFIATPDGPLLFFAALFLYAYRQYLLGENLKIYTLLFISIIGLAYSKYHGFLFLILIIISNISLVKNTKLWIVVFMSVMAYIPHLQWQYLHDFPSLNYHTTDRSSKFQWLYLLEYVPNQIFVFGPIGIFLCWHLYKHKKNLSQFQRSLVFVLLGFFIVFLLASFRGHVEPHWTVLISLPIFILTLQMFQVEQKFSTVFKSLLVIWIFLILVVRILIVYNPLPHKIPMFGDPTLYNSIQDVAKDHPVVFQGSFQQSSLYQYYTQKPSSVLSTASSRKTQFDIQKDHDEWYGKRVFIFGNVAKSKLYDQYPIAFSGFLCDSFQNIQNVKIEFFGNKNDIEIKNTIDIPIKIINNQPHPIQVNHPEFPVGIQMVVKKDNSETILDNIIPTKSKTIASGQSVIDTFYVKKENLGQGIYHLKFRVYSIFGVHLNQGNWQEVKLTK